MRIWIYGRDRNTVQTLISGNDPTNTVVGTSALPAQWTEFPLSGLTQAMCAAIQGELDLLLVSDCQLLGNDPQQIREMEAAFAYYGVSVKSASSCGSRSS